MQKIYYLSVNNENLYSEFLRFDNDFINRSELIKLSSEEIREVIMISIDIPNIKDLFLPFKKISQNARGNNLDYYVHLRTIFTELPWQYYQAKFNVSKNWKTFKLSLTDFKKSGVLLPNKINTNHIKSIALVAFGKEHEVELDVSNIDFIN